MDQKFLAEWIALAAITVLGMAIARRLRWNLWGRISAAGAFAILLGAPLTFLGWLVSRSEWLAHTQVVLWFGGALFTAGFVLLALALVFVPLPAMQGEQPCRIDSDDREPGG